MSRAIRLNGQDQTVDAETVAALLVSLGVDLERRGVAVAIDGQVVARRSWSETPVRPGAEIEIVRPLQGG